MVDGTAPLTLSHNRPHVTLSSGGRPVAALVDTAGASMLMAQSLADDLGLAVIDTIEEGGELFTMLEPPALSTPSGYELDTDGLAAYGFDDTRRVGLAAHGLDVVLPATLLRRHAVVLDPVEGVASFGDSGAFTPGGVRLPATVSTETGLVTVTVEVLGSACTLLLDTGVSCCLAADRLVRSWLSAVPDLPTSAAAVGVGNMAGLPVEARTPMVRVPAVVAGEFTVPGVAFVWRGDSDVAPFDGSLGGNVLRFFRLGFDHARGDVWVEQRAPVAAGGDADLVGVTLALDDEGEWRIEAAVSGLADAGVLVGDTLVAVDGAPVTGVGLGAVLAALAGEVGATHHLVLRRDGSLVEATAPVVRLL